MIAMLSADLVRLRTLALGLCRARRPVRAGRGDHGRHLIGGRVRRYDDGHPAPRAAHRQHGDHGRRRLALFAAMRVGGEYRYDTMGQRLLASPRRTGSLRRVWPSTAWSAWPWERSRWASAWRSRSDAGRRGPDHGHDPQIVAAVLFAVTGFSLIGVCCAVIFRSQSAAVLVIVGGLVVENLGHVHRRLRPRTCPTGCSPRCCASRARRSPRPQPRRSR